MGPLAQRQSFVLSRSLHNLFFQVSSFHCLLGLMLVWAGVGAFGQSCSGQCFPGQIRPAPPASRQSMMPGAGGGLAPGSRSLFTESSPAPDTVQLASAAGPALVRTASTRIFGPRT